LSYDLQFISGQFIDYELPPDKQYLHHYFTTDVQVAFLRYYLLFDGNCQHFQEHTGFICTKLWMKRLSKRIVKLDGVRKLAKESFDLTLLAKIESGNYEDYEVL